MDFINNQYYVTLLHAHNNDLITNKYQLLNYFEKQIKKDGAEFMQYTRFAKPTNGIWASPYENNGQYLSEWHNFANCELYYNDENNYAFIFKLKNNSKTLYINNVDDYTECIKEFPYPEVDILHPSEVNYSLDFNKLIKKYNSVYFGNVVHTLHDFCFKPINGKIINSLNSFDVKSLIFYDINEIDIDNSIILPIKDALNLPKVISNCEYEKVNYTDLVSEPDELYKCILFHINEMNNAYSMFYNNFIKMKNENFDEHKLNLYITVEKQLIECVNSHLHQLMISKIEHDDLSAMIQELYEKLNNNKNIFVINSNDDKFLNICRRHDELYNLFDSILKYSSIPKYTDFIEK